MPNPASRPRHEDLVRRAAAWVLPERSPAFRWGFALLAVLAALATRVALDPFLPRVAPMTVRWIPADVPRGSVTVQLDRGGMQLTLTPEGWLRTSDVAVVDDDGFLFLVDRAKDVVIVSGFNVYPAEVEEVLDQHPAVAEAAVVGVPEPIPSKGPEAASARSIR